MDKKAVACSGDFQDSPQHAPVQVAAQGHHLMYEIVNAQKCCMLNLAVVGLANTAEKCFGSISRLAHYNVIITQKHGCGLHHLPSL
jgi:hypothetical protein